MKQIWAIAKLTFRAAVRSRFMVIFMILLVMVVGALPFLIRHNGTASMFTQVMVIYTLIVLTTLLIGATVWMACGAISLEVAQCQMQILTTKPIGRWQIWLGKWLGLSLINATFLVVVGAMIYGLLFWGASQLPKKEQEALKKRLMVARGSLTEAPTDRTEAIERVFKARMNEEGIQDLDPRLVRQKIKDQFEVADEVVPDNTRRRWDIELGWRKDMLKDKPMSIRVNMQAAKLEFDDPVYKVLWVIGDIDTGKYMQKELDMLHNIAREIEIPPNMFDSSGKLRIECWNYSGSTLRFPLDEPLELLFPEGGFEMNYIRALIMIFFWLVTVAAIGLAASSYLTLPVAAFVSMTAMVVFMSGSLFGFVAEQRTMGEYDPDLGHTTTHLIDPFMVPVFKVLHEIVTMTQSSSPIEKLSMGRSVPLDDVAGAFFKHVVLVGGMLSIFGIVLFNRRELAALQGSDS